MAALQGRCCSPPAALRRQRPNGRPTAERAARRRRSGRHLARLPHTAVADRTLDATSNGEPLIYGPRRIRGNGERHDLLAQRGDGRHRVEAHVALRSPAKARTTSCPARHTANGGITGTPVIDPATRTIMRRRRMGWHPRASVTTSSWLSISKTVRCATGFSDQCRSLLSGGWQGRESASAARARARRQPGHHRYGGNDGDCSTTGAGSWRHRRAARARSSLPGRLRARRGSRRDLGGGNAPRSTRNANIYAATGNGKSNLSRTPKPNTTTATRC